MLYSVKVFIILSLSLSLSLSLLHAHPHRLGPSQKLPKMQLHLGKYIVRDVEWDNILNACHQELSAICVGLIQIAIWNIKKKSVYQR